MGKTSRVLAWSALAVGVTIALMYGIYVLLVPAGAVFGGLVLDFYADLVESGVEED